MTEPVDDEEGEAARILLQTPGVTALDFALDLAMTDGWTSGKGLGMGLTGSKRLVNEFDIDTKVGAGTRVTIARWT